MVRISSTETAESIGFLAIKESVRSMRSFFLFLTQIYTGEPLLYRKWQRIIVSWRNVCTFVE